MLERIVETHLFILLMLNNEKKVMRFAFIALTVPCLLHAFVFKKFLQMLKLRFDSSCQYTSCSVIVMKEVSSMSLTESALGCSSSMGPGSRCSNDHRPHHPCHRLHHLVCGSLLFPQHPSAASNRRSPYFCW